MGKWRGTALDSKLQNYLFVPFCKLMEIQPFPTITKRELPVCLMTGQRSKLTFSKSRLLATFNCKMVAITRLSPEIFSTRHGDQAAWSAEGLVKPGNNYNKHTYS